MFQSVREVIAYKDMVRNLVRREIRGRFKGSVLGFLWNFITPLMQILVYIAIFSMVFKTSLADYHIFIVVGMVPWILFADSLSNSSATIVSNSNLVTKVYFPRIVLPISIIASKMVNYLISLAITFIIIFATGYGVSITALLYLPLFIITFVLFTSGISFILSALDAYFRDVEYITGVFLMIFIWLTPIMYSLGTVENELLKSILSFNPIAYFIEGFQDILYWKVVPDIQIVLLSTVIGIALFLIGWKIFERLQADFAEVL